VQRAEWLNRSCLSSSVTSTNHRHPLINQPAPSTPQPISVGFFQRHLHLKIPLRLFSHPTLA